jgi:hypothetical protein
LKTFINVFYSHQSKNTVFFKNDQISKKKADKNEGQHSNHENIKHNKYGQKITISISKIF